MLRGPFQLKASIFMYAWYRMSRDMFDMRRPLEIQDYILKFHLTFLP
jgi:hypothetical protein